MAADLGLALFNVARSSVFSTRNVDKSAHGDFVRAGVAAGQAKNALVGLKDLDGTIGEYAKKAVNAIETTAKNKEVVGLGAKTLHYTAGVVDFASKWVNPLLCVSGGVKVAMADDKKSETIKQTSALGTMFLFEATGKRFFMEPVRKQFAKTALGKKSWVSKLLKQMDRLDNFHKTAGKSSNWVKYGIPILKGLAYVGMSITGYSVGAVAGNKINEWRKEDELPPAYRMAKLTGAKPVTQGEIDSIAGKKQLNCTA